MCAYCSAGCELGHACLAGPLWSGLRCKAGQSGGSQNAPSGAKTPVLTRRLVATSRPALHVYGRRPSVAVSGIHTGRKGIALLDARCSEHEHEYEHDYGPPHGEMTHSGPKHSLGGTESRTCPSVDGVRIRTRDICSRVYERTSGFLLRLAPKPCTFVGFYPTFPWERCLKRRLLRQGKCRTPLALR
jgi:hypothetical protein